MEKKFVWVGLGVLGLVLLMGVVGFFVIRANQSFHGSVIDPPSQAADFTLTDQSGREVRLSDYRGRYVLMFFGYTHCPDECPATMAWTAPSTVDPRGCKPARHAGGGPCLARLCLVAGPRSCIAG